MQNKNSCSTRSPASPSSPGGPVLPYHKRINLSYKGQKQEVQLLRLSQTVGMDFMDLQTLGPMGPA